jgi:histidinol dehydrogenase
MPAPLHVTRWSELDEEQRLQLLQRPVFDQPGLSASVAEIIDRVRGGGNRALRELTSELDGCSPASIEVANDDISRAAENIDESLRDAVADAAGRIRAFHEADKPRDGRVETAPGLVCEVRYQPHDAGHTGRPGRLRRNRDVLAARQRWAHCG